ncbi:MAG: hypothetical protein ABWX67_01335 [Allosphingosinicella sp.]
MLRRIPILKGAAAAAIFLVTGVAGASMPTGERHGAWHVVSITSMSGDGASADAAAVLTQENEAGEFSAAWDEGGPVRISVRIRSCSSDDEDFRQSYSVPTARWHALGPGKAADRLEADFGAWLDQARLACRETARLELFRMARLRPAARDFAARLRYLSGGR